MSSNDRQAAFRGEDRLTAYARERRRGARRSGARLGVIALAAAALCSLAGCGAEEVAGETGAQTVVGAQGLVEFTATPLAPVAEGPNEFHLELRVRPSLDPLAGATVTARAVMPSMGHEATAEPVIEEIEPGLYDVRDVVLSMPGEWQVRYMVDTPDLHDEAAFDYEVQ